MSTSEILAGGLRDLKLARVFGTRTPVAALPSLIEVLPNGDLSVRRGQLHLGGGATARRGRRRARRRRAALACRAAKRAAIPPLMPRCNGFDPGRPGRDSTRKCD